MASATAESLKQALEALNHNPDHDVRRQADNWLQDFQHTAEAWQVSDHLLHDPTNKAEVHYFCAQTLKKKCQRDFEELPSGAPSSLRDSVIALVLKFHDTSIVRTQLCLALVALVAHMGPGEWAGVSVVQFLSGRFSQQEQAVALPCLLELLLLLPQESMGYPSMYPDERWEFMRGLLTAAGDALNLLVSCLQMPHSMKVRAQIVESYGAWVRLACGRAGEKEDGARTLPGAETLATHPLTQAALEGLNNDETYDVAVDTTSELIRSTRIGFPDAEEVEPDQLPLVSVLVPRVMTLLPRFVAASRASADTTGTVDCPDDDETAKGMARLFAEVGEAYVSMFGTATPEVAQPVEALLEVAGYPEDSVAFMSFEFWYRLAGLLTRHMLPRVEGGAEAAQAEAARRRAFFTPAFVRLITSIQGRVRYPEHFEHWNKEQRMDFKRGRYAVADTLLDAAKVVGAEVCLELLVKPLEKLSQEVATGKAFEWRDAEAALYCIRSVSNSAPQPSNTLLAGLLAMLPTLPRHSQLLYTSCLTVSHYADWLSKAMQVGNANGLVPQLLNMLTSALEDENAAGAASMALRNLCDHCSSHMGPYLEGLMALYQAQMRTLAAGQQTKLEAEDVEQLVQGLCTVVSTLPEEQLKLGAHCLLEPLVARLEESMTTGAGGAGPSPRAVAQTVDYITCVFRYVACAPVVAEMFVQLWPLFNRAFAALAADERSTERLCRAIKYALRQSQGAAGCLAILSPLAQTLRAAFSAQAHASYLFCASETVRAFGGDSNGAVQQELQSMVDEMVMKATACLRKLDDFAEMPDVADDMFLLSCKCLTYAPHLLLTAANLPALVNCALSGMLVQHKEACQSVLDFLEQLMRLSASHPQKIPPTIQNVGQLLMNLLICATAGGLPYSRLGGVGDVLTTFLNDTCSGGQAPTWLQATLNAIPANALGDKQKHAFFNAVATRDRKTIQRALEDLSDVCRRTRTVQDAVRAVLMP